MLKETIKTRRSVRKFTGEMPPDEDILTIIDAGNSAPSARNGQAWRFIVVKDTDILGRIKQAIADKMAAIGEYALPEYKDKLSSYANYFFYDTPVYIIPIYNTAGYLERFIEDCPYLEPSREKDEKCSLMSVSFAVQNMLLMIHELGLATVFIGGALVAEEEICDILGLPDGWKIAGLLPLGYAAETPPALEKKPVDAVIKWM